MAGTSFERRADPGEIFSVFKEGSRVDGAYDLNGPLGNVSFYSQQRRAFYIAAKVKEYLESLPHKDDTDEALNNVLIVGGGLSGVTCFLALKAMGVTSVQMVELSEEPLHKQMQAKHRYAHPSLAEWPLGNTYNSTTDLPFLNWHSGRIDKVIAQIKRDPIWQSEFNGSALNPDVFLGTYLSSLSPITNDPYTGFFAARFTHVSREATAFARRGSFKYRSVVWAMGYDEVQGEQDFAGYWEVDVGDYIRKNLDKYFNRPVAITGAGDGAIIEAGNLCVKRGNIEELLVKLVSLLRHQSVRSFQSDSAINSPFEIAFEELLKKRSRPGDVNFDREMEQILEPYRDDIEKVFAEVEGRPTYHSAQQDVFMISKQHPWNAQSCSPVSLMAFHLLEKRDSQNVWGQGADFPALTLREENYEGGELRVGGRSTEKPILICRHGAKSKLKKYDYANHDSRHFYDGLGSFLDKGSYFEACRDGTFYQNYVDQHVVGATPWLKYKAKLAKAYTDTHFTDATVKLTPERTYEIYLDLKENALAYEKIGGLDRKIHGIDVVYRDKLELQRSLSRSVSDINEIDIR